MPFEADGKYAFIIEYANAILWEILLSVRIYIKKPFHIIHSANPPDHIFLIALLYKTFGVKFIFDHHDICPENYVAKFGRKDFFYRILIIMERLSLKIANIIISTNDSYKNIAVARGNRNREDVFVVRNGPQLSNIGNVIPNKKLKSGFKYLVTYVGVIGNQEGIDKLLRVIDYIINVKKILNIRFVIMGTGPHLNKMIEMAQQMRLDKWVTFTGYIPYKDFYEMLATSDLCVNPEPSNEFTDKSTMLKIMDYMTFSKPIVQFETKEGKVTAGKSAVYIKENDEAKFAEAIIELLSDKIKRNNMGAIGRKRIEEKLNWEIQKKNLVKAYKSLNIH